MFGFCDNDDGERGLVFEYMPKGNLKDFLNSDAEIPMEQRLRWCVEAAEGVAHLHSHGIFHCDISLRAWFWTTSLAFGSSIFPALRLTGKSPSRWRTPGFSAAGREGVCLLRRHDRPLRSGSSFYQIITGKKPYEDVESQEAEARYTRKEFPSVADVPFGDIIQRCWMCEISTVDVLSALKTEMMDTANGMPIKDTCILSQPVSEDDGPSPPCPN